MRLIHLSDFHLGKRVNEFSMLEDQEFILLQILEIIGREKADAVIIAGDLYDKPVPPAEAVRLFDDFLTRLVRRGIPVFIISGNHDSPERIAFGSRIMEAGGVYLSPVYDGRVKPVTLRDAHGPVNFWLLPFIKPAVVRAALPEAEISDYTGAVAAAIAGMEIDPAQRNILVSHQFVTGAERSDSEDVSVGGMDNVDASVFGDFDYVALGHIHGPQRIGTDRIRYCGTPLKYSFSERNHVKSVTVAELEEKGSLTVRTVPLTPRHDLREIRGKYDDLMLKSFYERQKTDDYLHVILTDENDVPDALAKLRLIYPNVMKLDYDNTRTRSSAVIGGAEKTEEKTAIQLFEEFYELQNGHPMEEEQRQFSRALLEKLGEAEA